MKYDSKAEIMIVVNLVSAFFTRRGVLELSIATMTRMPDPSRIGDDTLMRLAVAAALEFPDGSMSASGLRSEAAPWPSADLADRRQRLHHQKSIEGDAE